MVGSKKGRKGRGEMNRGEQGGKEGVTVLCVHTNVRTYVCADMCDTLCM